MVQISGPGLDDAVIIKAVMNERISELFEIDVIIQSNKVIDTTPLINKEACISIKGSGDKDEVERYWAGIIESAFIENMYEIHTKSKAAAHILHLKIVPTMFRLSLTKKYRIFQELSALEIIEKVLKDAGISNIKKNVSSAGQSKRIYCVQYYESDLEFISRLMEEEGIYYYFIHEKNNDTFCFADDSSATAHKVAPDLKVRRVRSQPNMYLDDVYNLAIGESLALKKIMSISFNEDKSAVVTGQSENSGVPYNIGDIEIYNNPFEDSSTGGTMSKTMLESGNTESKFVTGNSQSIGLYSGCLCTIGDSVIDSQNGDFLVVELAHTINQIESSGNEEMFYENSFELIPISIKFRPPIIHHKNRIHSTQTAIVSGASGEEIFCDEKGRIKVKFHWDTAGEYEDKASCWIRVAQVWAGKSFGGLVTPRVGMEVLVSFVNGDPDQPLITGCVYNGVNVTPGSYPKEKKTASSFYTDSSKGHAGFNELRFDDNAGKEEIFLHGQKDMNIIIENDVTETINDGNKIMTMESKKGKIKRELTIKEGDYIITLKKGDMTVTLEEGNQTITLKKGNQTVTLDEGDQTITLKKGNQTVKLDKGDITVKVEGSISIDASKDITIKAKGKITVDAKDDISIKSAKNISSESSMDTKVKGGMNIKMEATMNLEEKGLMIKREAQTNIQDKANAMMQLEGSAMLAAKGGIITLN
jgi:type VI secretion system secreted protein VgrG